MTQPPQSPAVTEARLETLRLVALTFPDRISPDEHGLLAYIDQQAALLKEREADTALISKMNRYAKFSFVRFPDCIEANGSFDGKSTNIVCGTQDLRDVLDVFPEASLLQ